MKAIKNLLFTAAIVGAATVAATAVISFGAQSKYGDVNGDGKVDTKDLIRLMRYISADGKDIEAFGADLNGDGKVDTKDLIRLMKCISNPGAYETDPPETEETLAHEDETEIPLGEIDATVGKVEKENGAEAVENWKELLDSAIEKTANLDELDIKAYRTLHATDSTSDYARVGNLKLRTSEGEIERAKLRESVSVGTETTENYIFYGADKAYLPLLEDPSYMNKKLGLYTLEQAAALYLPTGLDTSALNNVSAYKNNDGSVSLTVNATAEMLSGSSIDLIALRTEGLSHLKTIESPMAPSNIRLNLGISKDGYLTYINIGFDFNATLRIDPSNTRPRSMVFDLSVSFDNVGEKLSIGEPENLDLFIEYDAYDDIAEAIRAMFDGGKKIDGFDARYAELCDLYGKDYVDEVVQSLKLESEFGL